MHVNTVMIYLEVGGIELEKKNHCEDILSGPLHSSTGSWVLWAPSHPDNTHK